jgi:hypothetical protein
MFNTLQPMELTDSELDVVSGGTYKKFVKNSYNVINTSANGGAVAVNGSIAAGGDVILGNGGDASVHIG